MNYLESAFAQLEFSIKLMDAAERGTVKPEDIDVPMTVIDGPSVIALHDKIFSDPVDMIHALQNYVSVMFGAAAITLNRCREEYRLDLPNPIETERDQWIALVYQIRCAFAHDIAEPHWNINKARYIRTYSVRTVHADLTALNGQRFDYRHIGGAGALFDLKNYAEETIFR